MSEIEFPFMINDEKILEVENHTLFIDKEVVEPKPILASVDGEETMIQMPPIESTKYTLNLGDFIGDKLHKLTHKIREATEHDSIEIRIASNGGDIDDVLILMNNINELFIDKTTVIEANAFSAGAMIFTIGIERLVYDNVSLMIHNYSTGYGGKGGEIKSYIDFTDHHIQQLFKELFVKTKYITVEEYYDIVKGVDLWIDTKSMVERGLATHVIIGSYKLDAESYLEWCETDEDVGSWAIAKVEKQIEDIDAKKIGRPKGSKNKKKKQGE